MSFQFSIDKGDVIYKRGAEYGQNSYWGRIHRRNVMQASSLSRTYNNFADINKAANVARGLIRLGEQEREKEIALLEAVGFVGIDSSREIKDFVKVFNQVLIGSKNFKIASDKLALALGMETQGEKQKTLDIIPFFPKLLSSELNLRVNRLIKNNKEDFINKDFYIWEQKIEDIIDNSIDSALKKSLFKAAELKENNSVVVTSAWEDVYTAFNNLELFSEFRDMIKGTLNFDNIRDIKNKAKIIENQGKRGQNKKFIESQSGIGIKESGRADYMAKSAQDYINKALSQTDEITINISNKKTKKLKAKEIRATTATLFDFETSIDAQKIADKILEDLEKTLVNSTSLLSISNRMQKIYKTKLSKLNNSFIIYSNSRAVPSFSVPNGYNGKRKLGELSNILDGGKQKAALDQFIHVAYNTGEGALFDSSRKDVEESLKLTIMSSISNLLFDDWNTIGGEYSGGIKAIHVIVFEGIQIPMSVFLTAAGRALWEMEENMSSFVDVNITLPEKITHPEKIRINAPKGVGILQMKNYWNDQAKKAQDEATFKVDFLKNFKNEIYKYISF